MATIKILQNIISEQNFVYYKAEKQISNRDILTFLYQDAKGIIILEGLN